MVHGDEARCSGKTEVCAASTRLRAAAGSTWRCSSDCRHRVPHPSTRDDTLTPPPPGRRRCARRMALPPTTLRRARPPSGDAMGVQGWLGRGDGSWVGDRRVVRGQALGVDVGRPGTGRRPSSRGGHIGGQCPRAARRLRHRAHHHVGCVRSSVQQAGLTVDHASGSTLSTPTNPTSGRRRTWCEQDDPLMPRATARSPTRSDPVGEVATAADLADPSGIRERTNHRRRCGASPRRALWGCQPGPAGAVPTCSSTMIDGSRLHRWLSICFIDRHQSRSSPMSHPLVIVGAGPIGLAADALAQSRGLRTNVLEAGPAVGSAVRECGQVRPARRGPIAGRLDVERLLAPTGGPRLTRRQVLPTERQGRGLPRPVGRGAGGHRRGPRAVRLASRGIATHGRDRRVTPAVRRLRSRSRGDVLRSHSSGSLGGDRRLRHLARTEPARRRGRPPAIGMRLSPPTGSPTASPTSTTRRSGPATPAGTWPSPALVPPRQQLVGPGWLAQVAPQTGAPSVRRPGAEDAFGGGDIDQI